jgi:hypothetical protein
MLTKEGTGLGQNRGMKKLTECAVMGAKPEQNRKIVAACMCTARESIIKTARDAHKACTTKGRRTRKLNRTKRHIRQI